VVASERTQGAHRGFKTRVWFLVSSQGHTTVKGPVSSHVTTVLHGMAPASGVLTTPLRRRWSKYDHGYAPNVLQQNFSAPEPNRMWLSDITCVRTWQAWLYVAVIVDAFSRRIVGDYIDDQHAHRPGPRRTPSGRASPASGSRPGAPFGRSTSSFNSSTSCIDERPLFRINPIRFVAWLRNLPENRLRHFSALRRVRRRYARLPRWETERAEVPRERALAIFSMTFDAPLD
jgi:hypothetical protein